MGLATLVWFSDLRVERVRGTWRDPKNIVFPEDAQGELPTEGTSVRIVTDCHGQVESSSAKIGKVARFGDDWNIELADLSPFIRDRRSFERYSAELEVEFRLAEFQGSQWVSTITRNLSASGIFVATDARPAIGEILELQLKVNDEALPMKGWVVRHDDQLGGLGLEFLEVEPMAYLELTGLISQLRNAS